MTDYRKKYKDDYPYKIKELEKEVTTLAANLDIERKASENYHNAMVEARQQLAIQRDENQRLRDNLTEARAFIGKEVDADCGAREAPTRINEVKVNIDGWSLVFDRDTLKVVKR